MCCCHGFLLHNRSAYCVRDSKGEMVGLQLYGAGCAQDLTERAHTRLALTLWPVALHDTCRHHPRQIRVLLNHAELLPTWVCTGFGSLCFSSTQRVFTHCMQGCMSYRTIRERQTLEEIICQIMT